jgi:hypothetical protein
MFIYHNILQEKKMKFLKKVKDFLNSDSTKEKIEKAKEVAKKAKTGFDSACDKADLKLKEALAKKNEEKDSTDDATKEDIVESKEDIVEAKVEDIKEEVVEAKVEDTKEEVVEAKAEDTKEEVKEKKPKAKAKTKED